MGLQLIPVYEYYSQDPWRFAYSTDPNFGNGWMRAGVSFFAFGKNQAGTVPVYRYAATNPQRYLYSTNPNVGQGWKNEGVAFHAFKEASSTIATIPVQQVRAKDQNPWRYQYVPKYFNNFGDGWEFDLLAFHVFDAQPAA